MKYWPREAGRAPDLSLQHALESLLRDYKLVKILEGLEVSAESIPLQSKFGVTDRNSESRRLPISSKLQTLK